MFWIFWVLGGNCIRKIQFEARTNYKPLAMKGFQLALVLFAIAKSEDPLSRFLSITNLLSLK